MVDVMRSWSSPISAGERRLVANGARHAAEERRHLGARLDEAEDVVDEEQHVLALVTEVLGHRQAGEADAQPRAGRLVHLAVDERHAVDDTRLLHLQPEVVALARALADAREDGDAGVLRGHVVDELLDEHGLAETRAAVEADLPSADERRSEVDHLHPCLEHLELGRQVGEVGRIPVNRPALPALHGLALVDLLADDVPDPAQRRGTYGHADRGARVDDVGAARQAVGRIHGHRAHPVIAEMLLHFGDEVAGGATVRVGHRDAQRTRDLGQAVGEDGVDDDAFDLDDLADVLPCSLADMRLLGQLKGSGRATAQLRRCRKSIGA